MPKMAVTTLKPGLKLAQSIYSQNDDFLLAKGVMLSKQDIQNIISLGITAVSIEQVLPTNEGLASEESKEQNLKFLTSNINAKSIVTDKTRLAATHQIENIMLNIKEAGKLIIKPEQLHSTISDLAGGIFSNKHLAFNLHGLHDKDNYTFTHSVNVCILAMMTGITLGYSYKDLIVLGTGALLHDIGKMQIPDKILNKPGKLTAAEFKIMKTHPYLGCQLLRQVDGLKGLPALIALEHHESYDGSGYPLGVHKKDFHEYAQIVGIADKFDALTANRVYKTAHAPHEAYEMFAAAGNYIFEPHVVKAFLHNISIYPLKTIVVLNTLEIGVVIDTPKGRPLHPKIRLFFDADHQRLPQAKELYLDPKDTVAILRVLEKDEIAELNF